MERLKQHKLTLCLKKKHRGSRGIYLVVILLLFGQVTAQENTDRVVDLINKLNSPNADVRTNAAEALGEMGPEAISSFIEALNNEDENIRKFAAEAIEKLKSV